LHSFSGSIILGAAERYSGTGGLARSRAELRDTYHQVAMCIPTNRRRSEIPAPLSQDQTNAGARRMLAIVFLAAE